MGYRDYFDKKPTLGQSNNALVYLFAINAFLFILMRFLKLVFDLDYGSAAYDVFSKKILFWFTVSPQFITTLQKVWVLATYMFTNYSIIGFISNMLWLWSFGYVLQDLTGNKKLIPLYLYGGFFAGLCFWMLSSFIPFIKASIHPNYLLDGSQAAVVAVAIGTTKLSPKYKIFQHIGEGMSLWILTLIFIAVDLAFLATTNYAVAISHLVAGFSGYLFIAQLQKGRDFSTWMYNFVNKIDFAFNPEKKFTEQKTNKYHFYNSKENAFIKTENVTEKKVNEILDKIINKGYSSLSKSEIEFLERASKKNND